MAEEEKNTAKTEPVNEVDGAAAEPETDAVPVGGGDKNPKDSEPITFKSILSEVFDWVEIFVTSMAFVIILFTFFARLTIVQGPSMQDTLYAGDYLIVSDMLYKPEQGDIIVCHDLSTGYTDPIVKRVIATEGQTVSIDFSTWTVTVDGIVLDEDYRKLASDGYITSNWMVSGEEYTVPDGSVFVMGDNRNHSADSRISDIGFVDERCVVGHAILRLMPFEKFTVFS